MKITSISFLLFTLPLVLVSCMKVKNKNATDSPAVEPAQISATADMAYEIIPGEGPDSYSYKFPLQQKQNQLFVNRITSAGSAIESIETDTNGDWLDQKVPLANETTYQFGFFQDKQFKAIQVVTIARPKDLVLSGTMKWSQIKEHFAADALNRLSLQKFHRLYFKEATVLVTEGQNLNLYMKEFYAQNAEIQTWPEGQKATAGQAGRNGGQVFINAENVTGKLSVKLRGENGGDGLAGKADSSLNGAAGMPGVDHVVKGMNKRDCSIGCIDFVEYACVTPATSGAQGGSGRKGLKGGTGFRGGNSGFIQFKISNKFNLVWNFEVIPGLGGDGGTGGPGGDGGPGGPSGEWQVGMTYPNYNPAVKVPGPCAKPIDSLKGPLGERGDNGEPGQVGIKEISCITQGNQAPLCL